MQGTAPGHTPPEIGSTVDCAACGRETDLELARRDYPFPLWHWHPLRLPRCAECSGWTPEGREMFEAVRAEARKAKWVLGFGLGFLMVYLGVFLMLGLRLT